MARVVVAMSGGVDSSVAAALLVRAGYEAVGVFMRHGEPVATACTTAREPGETTAGQDGRTTLALPIVSPRAAHKQGCCTAADADDARRVAERLRIPFYALDLAEDFGRIIDYFVAEYVSARTPNPCVVCNHELKFGRLFDYADSIGARYVATGHYARIAAAAANEPALLRGVDATKDQSYVLFGIHRTLFSRMLLPIGGYRKSEIRALAHELGLRVADKPDSQEICFVAAGEHAELVRARRGELDTSGEIVTGDGRVVGRHEGIERFTIGQRKGLGVALGEPYYVVRIEAQTRRVVLGSRDELGRYELTAAGANWLVDPPAEPLRCRAKIRYNARAADATLEVLAGDRLALQFDEPQFGVAPGQAVVAYDGERVLGGGWIE